MFLARKCSQAGQGRGILRAVIQGLHPEAPRGGSLRGFPRGGDSRRRPGARCALARPAAQSILTRHSACSSPRPRTVTVAPRAWYRRHRARACSAALRSASSRVSRGRIQIVASQVSEPSSCISTAQPRRRTGEDASFTSGSLPGRRAAGVADDDAPLGALDDIEDGRGPGVSGAVGDGDEGSAGVVGEGGDARSRGRATG